MIQNDQIVMAKLTSFFDKRDDLKIFAMNGSRVNPNSKEDIFQDYDVVFFTVDVKKYKLNNQFLKEFGEVLLCTEPDDPSWSNQNLSFPKRDGYIYLVQYTDGLRLDIQFLSLHILDEYLTKDSLTKIISDKDHLVKKTITPSDVDYWKSAPEINQVSYSVKEFWWQFNNTLKSALRSEFLLAQFYLTLTRDELIRLMTWTTSLENGLDRNYGKKNDLILELIDTNYTQKLKTTYQTPTYDEVFTALTVLGDLENTFLEKLCQMSGYGSLSQLLDYKKIPYQFLVSKKENLLAELFKFKR